jgi:xylitol oxidase
LSTRPRKSSGPPRWYQLRELVASASRIKALGSRHSFNTVADTDGTHILLDALPQEIVLDPAKSTVKVSGGISYGALGRALEEQGYAIHNLASLPHISVAGAIQTGTHGSGVNNPSLGCRRRQH